MATEKRKVHGLVNKYYIRKNASKYEETRKYEEKWVFEESSLEKIMEQLPAAEIAYVADIPIGTNRFYAYLDLNPSVKLVYGCDLSPDMLSEAIKKKSRKYFFSNIDICAEAPNVVCGTVICFRFLNLLEYEDVERAVINMANMCEHNLIVSIRLHDDDAVESQVIQDKISIHSSRRFFQLLRNCGFSTFNSLHFPDSKGGAYYVVHASRGKE
jgi:SAM-dependent methyltransferase